MLASVLGSGGASVALTCPVTDWVVWFSVCGFWGSFYILDANPCWESRWHRLGPVALSAWQACLTARGGRGGTHSPRASGLTAPCFSFCVILPASQSPSVALAYPMPGGEAEGQAQRVDLTSQAEAPRPGGYPELLLGDRPTSWVSTGDPRQGQLPQKHQQGRDH